METKTFKYRLLEAQKEIGAIKKDSDNPFFKSKYFDINSILAEVKPKLNSRGLILTQSLKTKIEDGQKLTGIITTILDSDSDNFIESFVEIPTMSDPQKTGSAITYFRRYALQSMLALEAEDDDGNTASGKDTKKVGEKVINLDEPPF